MRTATLLVGIGMMELVCATQSSAQTTNRWINPSSDVWETAANWSLGIPAINNGAVLITNANTKAVTVDSSAHLSNLSVSNIYVSAPAGSVNTLQLVDMRKTLQAVDTMTIDPGGALLITNSTLTVGLDGLMCDGTMTLLSDGLMDLTGSFMTIGNYSNGMMFIRGGTLQIDYLGIGEGNLGTLTVSSGTLTMLAQLYVGDYYSTGTVWVTGGTVVLTNDDTFVGTYGGFGRVISSNVTINTSDVFVGEDGEAALTIVGGTLNISAGGFGALIIGQFDGGTGTTWVTGGAQLLVPNDLTTVGDDGVGQMVVSNGTALVNDLTVGNFGAGTLSIAGGTVNIATGQLSQLTIANGFGSTGVVQTTSGQLLAMQVSTIIGNSGAGQMIVNGGTVSSRDVWIGTSFGSSGTLTVAGGTNTLSSFLWIGVTNNARGAVWVTGGQLSVLNDATIIGSNGIGQATLSNGTTRLRDVIVASGPRAQGTLTAAGGLNILSSALTIGQAATATGSVWVTGGQLIVTDGPTLIGSNGVGRVMLSNGTVRVREMTLGNKPGSAGTLTLAGGTLSASSNLVIGDCGLGVVGVVVMTGGNLYVTNANRTAVLDVRDGSFIMSGGSLVADKLVITNTCARFTKLGGTLSASITNLAANLSAVGDGIPNGWKQQYGLDPFDPTLASKDSDADGFTNLQEYLAGTDPTNSASAFRITTVTKLANNIRVTWTMGPGKTNALQRTTSLVGGYSDIFIVTNTVGTVTNYLDVGAVTNDFPARYYRVRLLQ
jgi:hypothetical protein